DCSLALRPTDLLTFSLRIRHPPRPPLFPYTTLFRSRVPPEVRERIRDALGLNDPWPLRYVKWLTSLFRGDFGVSFMSHSPEEREIGRAHVCSSHVKISYAVFCLKKKKKTKT